MTEVTGSGTRCVLDLARSRSHATNLSPRACRPRSPSRSSICVISAVRTRALRAHHSRLCDEGALVALALEFGVADRAGLAALLEIARAARTTAAAGAAA